MSKSKTQKVEVVHVFKDGTTTTELKDVYVPQEIAKSIYKTVKNNEKWCNHGAIMVQ